MPVLVTDIHAVESNAGFARSIRTMVQYFRTLVQPNRVDGRDKPGHDGKGSGRPQ